MMTTMFHNVLFFNTNQLDLTIDVNEKKNVFMFSVSNITKKAFPTYLDAFLYMNAFVDGLRREETVFFQQLGLNVECRSFVKPQLFSRN